MASSNTLLSQINEDFLTCRICMDTFNQPKVLSCQHSFCSTCLESCSKTENGSYMVCPVCRQRTVLGLQGVKSLKDNFVFSNMIEMLQTWKKSQLISNPTRSMDSIDGSDVMCNTCPDGQPTMATFQCLDCLDQLCADCAAFHSRAKLTKDHEVVPLEEIESGMHEKAIRSRELSRCRDHGNVQMQHYCENCDVPVCRDCIIDCHQTHSHIQLDDAENKQRQNVILMKSDLEIGMKNLEDSLKKTEELEARELGAMNDISAEIKRMAEKAIDLIKKKESDLHEELERTRKENVDQIGACKDGLLTQLNCMENCIHFSNCVLEDGATIEVITMNRQMRETVKELRSKVEEAMTRNETMNKSITQIKFESNDLSTSSPLLGRLISSSKIEKESKKDVQSKGLDHGPKLDNGKNSFVVQLKPPKTPPKPSPRNIQNDSGMKLEKWGSFKKPEPMKRRKKQGNTMIQVEPRHRMSVFDLTQQIGDGLAVMPVARAKSVTDLTLIGSSQLSLPKSEHRRLAPLPPGTVRKNKNLSPKKMKAPLPPPKLPKKPLPLTPDKGAKRQPAEPIKASRLVKFGKKGKVITNGEFIGPPRCAIFSGPKRKILVLDGESKHVLVFNMDGWFKKSFNVALENQGSYNNKNKLAQVKPVSIAETSDRRLLVLYKTFVTIWTWDGNMEHVWGTVDLQDATSVATDTTGRIVISDQARHMVFVYDAHTKQKVLQFGGFGDRDDLLKSPRYICTNRMDNIIVSDHHNNCIKIFNKEGNFLFKFGERGTGDGEFRYPEAVICLKLENGDDGILVADEGNCRVTLFSSEGKFVSHVLTKQEDKGLIAPQFLSVSLDGRGEELMVRQSNQMQIRVYRLFQFVDRTS